jgi:membrane associated rhomboid family serine protease
MTAGMPDPAPGYCYRHPDRPSYVLCQRCGRTICPECQTPAAVGVICPEDMRAQRQEARQQRPPLARRVSRLNASGAPVVTYSVIAVTVVVWLLQLVPGFGDAVTNSLAFNPLFLLPVEGYYQPWRAVTALFAHSPSSVLHVLFNMFSLYIFGRILEPMLGRWRFLALYLLSGIGGSVGVLLLAGGSVVGASGAIFGLMGALLVLAFKVGGDVRGVLTWIGINAVITVLFINNISWQGHLGGFLGGLACAGVIIYAPRGPQRTRIQVAGLAAISAVVLAAIVARSVMLSG